MTKNRFEFNAHERKFHVLTAFRLYQVEMYVAQKAMGTKKIKCSKCENIEERKLEDIFEDYQTQTSLSVLFETIAVFEPAMYERIKAMEIVDAIAETVSYLTGDKVKTENLVAPASEPKPKGAKSTADGAVQAKDLLDKSKIIITKTMPKSKK